MLTPGFLSQNICVLYPLYRRWCKHRSAAPRHRSATDIQDLRTQSLGGKSKLEKWRKEPKIHETLSNPQNYEEKRNTYTGLASACVLVCRPAARPCVVRSVASTTEALEDSQVTKTRETNDKVVNNDQNTRETQQKRNWPKI